jgi:acetyltransferase-like isoleucine patch superfamily enzyme
VGAWAFVGAGSVVLRRVAPGAKVFGNPAVAIGPA